MKTPKILSISEARKNIFSLVDEASKPGNYIILTENGRPKAVVLSIEEFESWKETLEVQAMFPGLREEADKAKQSYQWGNFITLEELLAKEGYVLADKGKKQYGVSNRSLTPRAKRPRPNKRPKA